MPAQNEWGGSRVYHKLITRWDGYHPRTYRLREETIARLDALAGELSVGVSDLVDFLLAEVLDQVEAATLEVPTMALELRVIDRHNKRG